MRRTVAALALPALCVIAAACGQAAADTTPGQVWHPVSAPVARPVEIVGGTPAQRQLLHRIVAAMVVSQVKVLRIQPVDRSWTDTRARDVQLIGRLRGTRRQAQSNERGYWELTVIGGAFRDLSAAANLPRVVVLGDQVGGGRISYESRRYPSRPAGGAAALEQRIAVRLAAAGFDRGYVQVGTPDGYAIAVDVIAPRPGRFLQHRKAALEAVLARYRTTDGVLITVSTADGKPVYSGGGAARVGQGFGWIDPRYQSCTDWDPFGDTAMKNAPRPPPCPKD